LLFQHELATRANGLYPILDQVRRDLAASGVLDGLVVVYCPHTTASVALSEGFDEDVARDLGLGLERAFPDQPGFVHAEGNSSAHLKSFAVGASQSLIVDQGALLLGRWQSIFFCEFDGPRQRRYLVKVLGPSRGELP
jgi:secondary thiamine-phosphate synthase enzyme